MKRLSKSIRNAHPKIIRAVQEMIVRPDLKMMWYGNFALHINFREEKSVGTIGVRFTRKGMEMVYNSEFVDKQTDETMRFVMIHEILHLVSQHQYRADKWNADKDIANVVMDQIINTEITRNYSAVTKMYEFEDDPDYKLLIPPEYNNDHDKEIWELLYNWAMELRTTHKTEFKKYSKIVSDYTKNLLQKIISGSLKKDEDVVKELNKAITQELKDEIKKDFPNNSDEFRVLIQSLVLKENGQNGDVHLKDEVPPEIAKSIAERVRTALANRGLNTSTEDGILGKLVKRKKDYTKQLKIVSQFLKSSISQRTYVKPNRKRIKGLKGKVKTPVGAINCIIDTSSSMYGSIETLMSFIFKNDLIVNLIQIDTEVKKINILKSMNDFKSLKMYGFGGTVLQPAIDKIVGEHNLKRLNTVILTDGYTDTLDMSGLKKVLVLTTGSEVPISETPRHLKQVIINDPNNN
jgi:predicted metal-dependent peptidase